VVVLETACKFESCSGHNKLKGFKSLDLKPFSLNQFLLFGYKIFKSLIRNSLDGSIPNAGFAVSARFVAALRKVLPNEPKAFFNSLFQTN
jgi:hypothetical protein